MILASQHLQGNTTKSYFLPVAPPPPYHSATSVHEDDRSSGLWSDSASSYNNAKRRSWDNLVNADANLKNLKANAYPKVSSSTCSAQSLPHKVSPNNFYSAQSTQFDSKPTTGRYLSSTSNSVFSESVSGIDHMTYSHVTDQTNGVQTKLHDGSFASWRLLVGDPCWNAR